MVTENGIHLPLMKVISNTILFVYSLRGALIKIVRMCHMRWHNHFDGTNPISCLQSRRSLGFATRFCPYSCRAGTRDANVCVERLSHFLKRSEGIQLPSPTPIIANISHLKELCHEIQPN